MNFLGAILISFGFLYIFNENQVIGVGIFSLVMGIIFVFEDE